MYETREIGLADKEKIDSITRRYSCDYSSHAFDSLFLWRNQMKLTLYLEEDFFAVKCNERGENAWFFPCGNENSMKKFLDYVISLDDAELCYVGKREKIFLQNYAEHSFHINREYESDEYIYCIDEHLKLQGKNYANVRTQLNKAEREHNCTTKLFSEVTTEEVKEIFDEWNLVGDRNKIASFQMDQAENDALDYRNELQLDGVVVFLDGKAFGVALGFPLSDETFDLFAAKERKTLPGMAYYVKHELFRYLGDKYMYVNIEEDLGNEGLRRMKMSLCPVKQNKMWKAIKRR